MHTYLITGGEGFIESSLSGRLIKEGNKVIAIDNFCDFYSKKVKENNVKNLLKNENFKLYRKEKSYNNYKVINDFEEFLKQYDAILANRLDHKLLTTKDKVYTRDLYSRD